MTNPDDHRDLVESACGAAALNALAMLLGGEWPEPREKWLAESGAHRGMALFQSVEWHKPWREAVPVQADGALLPVIEGLVAEPPALHFSVRGRGFVHDRCGLAVADQ